jgi:hypothetical protein
MLTLKEPLLVNEPKVTIETTLAATTSPPSCPTDGCQNASLGTLPPTTHSPHPPRNGCGSRGYGGQRGGRRGGRNGGGSGCSGSNNST